MYMKINKPVTQFFIVGIFGTLWHFLYEWSGKNMFIGIIAPINESTWEHLKLLFFPVLIYSVIEYIVWKERPDNYFSAAGIGLFGGMLAIAAFFYTYTGILGFNIPVLDISSYFIGLFTMLFIKSRIIRNKSFSSVYAAGITLFFIIITAVLFGIFSFNAPELGIFMPPRI